MNCQQIHNLKHAYIDSELDLVHAAEIEKHLPQCEGCSKEIQNLRGLRSALKTDDLYFKAPLGLENRVRSAIRGDVRGPHKSASLVSRLKWAFSFAGTAVLASVLTLVLLRTSPDDRLAMEVTSSHVRALMPGHLMDVISTDQHTVKPWFDGKVDFAPPVVNPDEQGFPLRGGRLDYLENRPVAALVYQHQKHYINLFVWPVAKSADSVETSFILNGYNLIHWDAAGMTYWAVSDLNRIELHDFQQLIKTLATPPAPRQ